MKGKRKKYKIIGLPLHDQSRGKFLVIYNAYGLIDWLGCWASFACLLQGTSTALFERGRNVLWRQLVFIFATRETLGVV